MFTESEQVRSIEKSERVRDEIKYSCYTHSIILSHAGLGRFPQEMFSDETIGKLIRLDLSFNNISALPANMDVLVSLRELWISNNPFDKFPTGITSLSKLEMLDISHTKINDVPTEVGTLQSLYNIDWRNTPLENTLKMKFGIQTNDLFELQLVLCDMNLRRQYEDELFEVLFGEHFLMDADKPSARSLINGLVQDISAAFEELPELKLFVKRAGKYLPPSLDKLGPRTIETAKKLYYDMKRDTDKKRMAADVEIKLRGMYFDRIERAEVTVLLDSIYEHVHALEDIQFLVQYAPQVLPPEPKVANGAVIWVNILNLQEELTNKRNTSVNLLSNAMLQLYPEQKPELLLEKATEIAKHLQVERFATKKELTKMSQLTAECAKIFPPDFSSVDADHIIHQAQKTIFRKQ